MKLNDYEKKQIKVLDAFYKDFFTWSATNIGYWMVTGIMLFCLCIMMFVPYQEFAQDPDFSKGFLLIMGGMGAFSYILPYVTFHENQKPRSVYGILKHLPVSVKTIKYYRMRKLVVFLLKVGAGCLVVQFLPALIGYHEIVLGNVLYPLIYGFIVPLFFGGLYLIFVE